MDDFWHWWGATGAAATASAIDRGDPQAVAEDLSERVGVLDGALSWELAPGVDARHRLVVTAGGDPELRATARRWLRAAPPADATWEYADMRAGVPDLTRAGLELDRHRSLGLDEVLLGVERRGHALDVVVHHPEFPGLPDEARTAVAFLALDAALGESDVETWIGDVGVATTPPPHAVRLRDLPAEVAALRSDSLDDAGHPTWVLLRGEGPDGPLVALAQVPLVAAAAPHLDQHVTVRVPFADLTDTGLPAPASLDALRDLEDHLVARLGDGGRLVAHETSAGVRTLHFYVESTGPGAAVVRGAVGGWTQGLVRVADAPDAAWHAVGHLRT